MPAEKEVQTVYRYRCPTCKTWLYSTPQEGLAHFAYRTGVYHKYLHHIRKLTHRVRPAYDSQDAVEYLRIYGGIEVQKVNVCYPDKPRVIDNGHVFFGHTYRSFMIDQAGNATRIVLERCKPGVYILSVWESDQAKGFIEDGKGGE